MFSACLLAGLSSSPGLAQAAPTVSGWNVNGSVDGVDTIEPQKTVAGEEVLLTIDKISPYQAGQTLQVFKSFDATAWRGKRIQISFDLDAELTVDTRLIDGIQPQLLVRMQCEKMNRTRNYPITKGKSKWAIAMDIEVPKDATVCGFGFSIFRPMKIAVKKLKFSEAVNPAPTPLFTMEGRQLFPLPKPGTALPELEVSKPAVP